MALIYLQQNELSTNRPYLPQLMLIDINMPVLNGFEFVKELKKTILICSTILCCAFYLLRCM